MLLQCLKDLRINNNLTQPEGATISSCQREVYRRYEKGTRQIPVDLLIKLADYYNVSIDYLTGLTDKKEPYPRK